MIALKDPKLDRVYKELPLPPITTLESFAIWNNDDNLPDWKAIKEHLRKEGLIAKEDIVKLLTRACRIVKKEPNVIQIKDPITIVGDIHGQYYDLLKLLNVGGDPEITKYLFLGDYVDRGSFSVEVMILILSLKINFSDSIYLLRGNHECRQMTTYFNFRQETLSKYDIEVFDLMIDFFDCLPLAAIVNSRFLAVHGGISPELRTIDELQKINRFGEPPNNGVIW